MNTNLSLQKPDTIGALSSGLCMIHCLATPIFFIASACSSSCCSSAPLWWQWLDYFFLVVSFIAIRYSTVSTNSILVKIGLWSSWIGLFICIINAKFGWFYLSPNIKFIPAFSIIGFHLYNLKYCKCNNDNCCVAK
ncbi:MAG: hypothetical protein CMP60_07220 [Flavobacteriales bacterium]|nr:hypothetical protein [Flavobacteriales bacterium]|tara:strand:+ start:5929 stop:6336 length:408 start_codon:yes stop_codon:yes gene_type:complete